MIILRWVKVNGVSSPENRGNNIVDGLSAEWKCLDLLRLSLRINIHYLFDARSVVNVFFERKEKLSLVAPLSLASFFFSYSTLLLC